MHKLTRLRYDYLAYRERCIVADDQNEKRRRSAQKAREILEAAAAAENHTEIERLTSLLHDLEAAHKNNREERSQAWDNMRERQDEIAEFYAERFEEGPLPVDWTIHLEKQLLKDKAGRVEIDRTNCVASVELLEVEIKAIIENTRLVFLKQFENGRLHAGFTHSKAANGRDLARVLLPLLDKSKCPTAQVLEVTDSLDVLREDRE